jgi:hypothetical protein
MAECARCHRQPNKDEPTPLLCRCNEVEIWEKHDRHRMAHQVLLGERARHMGKSLGIPDVSADERCLSCHGVVIKDERLRHRSFSPDRAVREGVTCVVCHGAYKDWIDLHGGIDRETWRTLSRSKKESDYGMTDLWNPVRRASLCLSCHVGAPAEGKVVTHAMYAAGHPPLRAFEVATASDRMPRHWQYLQEKPPQVRAMLQVPEAFVRLERTHLLLVSSLVAYRQSQELLILFTDPEASAASAHQVSWPEFSQFQCTSCHRQLPADSWQSLPSGGYPTGRPPWNSLHARLIVPFFQPAREPQAGLERAFRVRTLGDRQSILHQARLNKDWADTMLTDVAGTLPDRRAQLSVIHRLVAFGTDATHDFDGARQLVWSLRVILSDFDTKPRSPEFEDILVQLDSALLLSPLHSDPGILDQPPDTRLRAIYEAEQRFDPKTFRSTVKAIKRLLPGPSP